MTLAASLLEGWPIYAAIGLVALITYGALRPYLKKDSIRQARRKEMEE